MGAGTGAGEGVGLVGWRATAGADAALACGMGAWGQAGVLRLWPWVP
jgi:hypothetical protein